MRLSSAAEILQYWQDMFTLLCEARAGSCNDAPFAFDTVLADQNFLDDRVTFLGRYAVATAVLICRLYLLLAA